jgi:hypothetical protein
MTSHGTRDLIGDIKAGSKLRIPEEGEKDSGVNVKTIPG